MAKGLADPTAIQLRNCPICDVPCSASGLIGELRPTTPSTRDSFLLTECPCAELIYLSPTPTAADLDKIYQELGQFGEGSVYSDPAHGDAIVAYMQDRFRALSGRVGASMPGPISILEVGAGLAWLCRVAKQLNPEAATVAQDISREGVDQCPWVDTYVVGEIADRRLDGLGPFDVISMTHVIEHLVDPMAALRRVAGLLRPGGVLFITAPHRPVGWQSDRAIETWARYSYNHVPAHIQYFARGAMERAAARAGLVLLHWDASHEDGQAFEAWLAPRPPEPQAAPPPPPPAARATFGARLGEAGRRAWRAWKAGPPRPQPRAVRSSDISTTRGPGAGLRQRQGRIPMLNPAVEERAAFYAEQFGGAVPFKHVCIEDFFEASLAEGLLKEFPRFASDKALNEIGEVGQKAVFEKLSDIGPSYAAVARGLGSDEFSAFLTRVTGIPQLLWGGESMYGGGTHENLDGIDLDAHVDFNYDDRTGLHRRLNALVYLNTEWDDAWGGALELHSDPRDPAHNYVKTFSPRFNRCVIFETNERSWHGFPRIVLPPDKKHLSRKSLASYFYTKDRPAEETVGGHTTFYVQRPIPATVRPGEVLSPEDYALVQHLVYKRDVFVKLYQDMQVRDGEAKAHLQRQINQLQDELARERASREVNVGDASAKTLATALSGRVARGAARRTRSVLRRIPGARALRRRLLGL